MSYLDKQLEEDEKELTFGKKVKYIGYLVILIIVVPCLFIYAICLASWRAIKGMAGIR
jgi:hypothetical protein